MQESGPDWWDTAYALNMQAIYGMVFLVATIHMSRSQEVQMNVVTATIYLIIRLKDLLLVVHVMFRVYAAHPSCREVVLLLV